MFPISSPRACAFDTAPIVISGLGSVIYWFVSRMEKWRSLFKPSPMWPARASILFAVPRSQIRVHEQ